MHLALPESQGSWGDELSSEALWRIFKPWQTHSCSLELSHLAAVKYRRDLLQTYGHRWTPTPPDGIVICINQTSSFWVKLFKSQFLSQIISKLFSIEVPICATNFYLCTILQPWQRSAWKERIKGVIQPPLSKQILAAIHCHFWKQQGAQLRRPMKTIWRIKKKRIWKLKREKKLEEAAVCEQTTRRTSLHWHLKRKRGGRSLAGAVIDLRGASWERCSGRLPGGSWFWPLFNCMRLKY